MGYQLFERIFNAISLLEEKNKSHNNNNNNNNNEKCKLHLLNLVNCHFNPSFIFIILVCKFAFAIIISHSIPEPY